MAKLTDQECPNCGAATLGGNDTIEYNPEHPWQSMKCDKCGTTWQVEYSVTGIDHVVVAEP